MIPFTAKITNVTATHPPMQIPAKTKLSLLSIIPQKSVQLFVKLFRHPLVQPKFL